MLLWLALSLCHWWGFLLGFCTCCLDCPVPPGNRLRKRVLSHFLPPGQVFRDWFWLVSCWSGKPTRIRLSDAGASRVGAHNMEVWHGVESPVRAHWHCCCCTLGRTVSECWTGWVSYGALLMGQDQLATISLPLLLQKRRLHGAGQMGTDLLPLSLLGCPCPNLLAREQAFSVLVVLSFVCNYWAFWAASLSLASSSGYMTRKRNPRTHWGLWPTAFSFLSSEFFYNCIYWIIPGLFRCS